MFFTRCPGTAVLLVPACSRPAFSSRSVRPALLITLLVGGFGIVFILSVGFIGFFFPVGIAFVLAIGKFGIVPPPFF